MQSLLDSCNDRDVCLDSVEKLTEDFTVQLKMNESMIDDISNQENEINDHDQRDGDETEDEEEHDGEETDDDDDDDDDEEFSFVCGTDTSPIAAEEVFYNGQIRPMFPLFNGDFVLADGEFEKLEEQLHLRPSVKKVFIETEDNSPATTSSSSNENEEIAGPYCEWSKKAVEVEAANPDQACKKSNSTGFSKLWRFRDFGHRSNSDGRDAFVFLNNSRPKTGEQVVQKKIDGEVKVNRDTSGEKVTQLKKKKTVVKKSEAVLAHEAYMKSRAKDGERRRSYLPYRPELVGFFTNVNGGLTRNVHPF